jgi:hypothetical protein
MEEKQQEEMMPISVGLQDQVAMDVDICYLTRLPFEILRLIANYFLKEEDQNKKVFFFCRDWRNFLNTKKTHFAGWKKESQLILLQCPGVEKFYSSPEIRNQILNYIEDPRKQLELNFNFSYDSYHLYGRKSVDMELMNNVKRVRLYLAEVAPFPVDVEELEFDSCSFVRKFNPSVFSFIPNFSFKDDDLDSTGQLDVSTLDGLKKAVFFIQECINYPCLANLKSLEIGTCDNLTDVSCFGHIPKLKLSSCINVTDVSALGNCSDLDLSYGRGITDVSALGNVRKLCLYGCANITDVSSLCNVQVLDLSSCIRITDVSGLKAVTTLMITGCRDIKNITMLNSLKVLHMKGCDEIGDLKGLVHLKKLETDANQSRRFIETNSFPIISQLTEFIVRENWNDFIFNVQYLPFLQNIPCLRIYSCPLLTAFPSLCNLRSLTIYACDCFSSLPLLPKLEHLDIFYCETLEVLEILGSAEMEYPIYEMKIQQCKKLRTVSFHRKVFECRIGHCKNILTVEVLNQMDLLKINHCEKLGKIINKCRIVCLDLFGGTRFYDNEGNDFTLGDEDSGSEGGESFEGDDDM